MLSLSFACLRSSLFRLPTEFLALHGSSSPIVHVDNKSTHITEEQRRSIAATNARLYPEYATALGMAQEVVLKPGDALLIPALWCHAIITPTFSVGVSVAATSSRDN